MNHKLIGILAGMGPRSTAPFIDLVMDECQSQYGAKQDEEFPEMIIYSLPTPFYVDRPIDHDLMKKTIVGGLKKLESTGVDFIAMPCNSAHIYFDELQEDIHIPLLNIVDETIKKLPETPQKVTLFSTNSTFESEIYQKGIRNGGHEFLFKAEWQVKINQLIKSIKVNKEDPRNLRLWSSLADEVETESVGNIVTACTDLNVVLEKIRIPVCFIDSSTCLAEAVVRKYLE